MVKQHKPLDPRQLRQLRRIGFALAWGILNFFFIALLRRPALSGALSLTLVVLLVLLSRLKHDVVQMTAKVVGVFEADGDAQ